MWILNALYIKHNVSLSICAIINTYRVVVQIKLVRITITYVLIKFRIPCISIFKTNLQTT
jgi:hypothetical protein